MRIALACLALSLLGAGSAAASSSRIPGDLRPSAADGSARAIWTNPAMLGAAETTSLVIEGVWTENVAGDFDWDDPAYFTIAASTDRAGYGYRRELGDVPGVPDWAFFLSGRSVTRQGWSFGSTVEWRGKKDFDATVGLVVPMGPLRAAIAAEDLFETDIDGTEAVRNWIGGVAWRPAGGTGFLAWDVRSPEEGGDTVHWFSIGVDRAKRLRLTASRDLDGNWSARAGLVFGSAIASAAATWPEEGAQHAVAAIDFEAEPIVRVLR